MRIHVAALGVCLLLAGPSGARGATLAVDAPDEATVGLPLTITTSGTTDPTTSPRLIVAALKGNACPVAKPPSPGAKGLVDDAALDANAAWSRPRTWTFGAAGPWVICAWLQNLGAKPPTLMALAARPVDVRATPSASAPGAGSEPCTVPRSVGGMTLRSVKRRLTNANCRFKVARMNSKRPKGRVDHLSPRGGKSLPAQSRVTIYVSKG